MYIIISPDQDFRCIKVSFIRIAKTSKQITQFGIVPNKVEYPEENPVKTD